MFPDDFDKEKLANIWAALYMILVGITLIAITTLGLIYCLK